MTSMSKAIIGFVRGTSSLDWAVRAFTLSAYSHCFIQIPSVNGSFFFEAVPFHGVRRLLASRVPYIYPNKTVDYYEVDISTPQAAYAVLASAVGRPYDWSAIFSFVLPFLPQKSSAWYCSELVMSALHRGGLRDSLSQAARISPEMLHKIVSAHGRRVP